MLVSFFFHYVAFFPYLQKVMVWCPVKAPPLWCDLDPLDDWGVPEYSTEDLYSDLFQRRARRDKNPPSIHDYKFGNQYLHVADVSITYENKLLLRRFSTHMDYVRSICHKMKVAENKHFLDEIHYMLRALLPSVRQFTFEHCYEHVKRFVPSSLLRYNTESIFFQCLHCYAHCADILRLLSVIQAHEETFTHDVFVKMLPLVSRWTGITYTLCKFHKYCD